MKDTFLDQMDAPADLERGPEDINVLIGCETSGAMREAFLALGFNVFSCDLLPSDQPSNRHIQDDIRRVMKDPFWDLLCVMHPPCTRLCNSGVRWLDDPRQKNPPEGATADERGAWPDLEMDSRRAIMHRLLTEGADLFSACWNAPIPLRAVENPVMHKHAKRLIRNYQKPSQTVQPWWFGDPAFKATSFYLHELPALEATNRLTPPQKGTQAHKEWSQVHRASPGPDRWKTRSATYPGIAEAAAEQWGAHALIHTNQKAKQ